MEKNNIFDGACFGKPYRTRDGKKAIYTMMSCGSHWLAIQNSSFTWEYDNQGKLVSNIDNGMDIISEWQEEINDEELHNYALMYYHNSPQYKYNVDKVCKAFEAGYCKAIEE